MIDALERALDELVPRYKEPRRWDEVVQRASVRLHRRRVLTLAFAAGLAAVLIGAGGVFHREFVDFFSADPAPEPIRIDFAKMGARTNIMVGPGHDMAEAREVTRFPVDGELRPLWAAPMKNGGYCYRWHTVGSCGRMPHQGDAVKLGLGGQEGSYGLNWLVGHVSDPAIQRLELEYADGERVELPFVWVSSPIDAGFTAFQVPEERQREGRHAFAVTGFDGNGKPVERRELPVKSDPRWEAAADGLPRIADRSQKRTLFDFRDESGARWTLVVAPAPEQKLCYAYNRGGGCVSPRFGATPLSVQGGGKTVIVCCTVKESVTKVQLLFQDGDRIEVAPADGFLLHAVPSEHYPRGKRLEAIVSRDALGREVERVAVEPIIRASTRASAARRSNSATGRGSALSSSWRSCGSCGGASARLAQVRPAPSPGLSSCAAGPSPSAPCGGLRVPSALIVSSRHEARHRLPLVRDAASP